VLALLTPRTAAVEHAVRGLGKTATEPQLDETQQLDGPRGPTIIL